MSTGRLGISHPRQDGATAVEFAIIAMVFFLILLGIIEFGRLLYVWNSVQQVTRQAAREAVVRWVDAPQIKSSALFGAANLPAGAEIDEEAIQVVYLTPNGAEVTNPPLSAGDNISECLSNTARCIGQVRVSVNATYNPMIGLFTFLEIPIPPSTVTMPAESLGYRP